MSIKQGNTDVLHSLLNIPISPIINSSSTNDECSGAKAVYDLVKDQITVNIMQNGDDMNLIPLLGHNSWHNISNATMPNILNSPYSQGITTSTNGGIVFTYALGLVRQVFINNMSEVFVRTGYYETQSSTTVTWNDPIWRKMCTTKVQDIATKIIDIINIPSLTTNATEITVTNGICFVKFECGCNTTSDINVSWVAITNDILPLCKATQKFTIVCSPSGKSIAGTIDVNSNNIKIFGTIPSGTSGLYGGISYPVKES